MTSPYCTMPSRIEVKRAGGTIPSCDKVLISFAMFLAQKYSWTMPRLCEFLAEPWAYQKEWNLWLREMQEVCDG